MQSLTLTELPLRMRSLAKDDRGVPVPWFLPNHPGQWLRAVREGVCWVCGQHLGQHQAFVVEPIAAITRKALEPASHRQCAEWRVRNCPEEWAVIPPWPGVALLFIAESFTVHKDGRGQLAIRLGEPERCQWWRHGRPATREEVADAIEPRFLELEGQTDQDWDQVSALYRRKAEVECYYPTK